MGLADEQAGTANYYYCVQHESSQGLGSQGLGSLRSANGFENSERSNPIARNAASTTAARIRSLFTHLQKMWKRPLMGSSKTPSVILFLSKHGIS